MFGFQRVGDLIWAASDMRAKGFFIGGTSGRTTLPGEGLQHADGHSHLLAFTVPSVKAYDPTYGYEVAIIVREALQKMYVDNEDLIYYITVMNEKYSMPEIPDDVEEGILKGMYRIRKTKKRKKERKVHLLGSGALLREALSAADILEEKFDIPADVWSVTSYKELYYDAIDTERGTLRRNKKGQSYIAECFDSEDGDVFVSVSDYMKALPLTVGKYFPGDFYALGTDGFGRSDNRKALRDFFEVDAHHIAFTAISGLVWKKKLGTKMIDKALSELKINKGRANPAFVDI
jgi:pyruvate dehydrogenase E1 component